MLLSWASALALTSACASSDRTPATRSPAGPEFSEAKGATVDPQPLAASDSDKRISPDDQLFFAFDSDLLDRDGEALLVEVAAWAKANPAREVVVQGHADSAGDQAYNMELSARRARAVADQLQRLGVQRDRIVTVAVGEADASLDPSQVNRRVVIFATGAELQSSR